MGILFGLLVFAISSPLEAAIINIDFDGGPGGLGTAWNTAVNWNPDGVPNNGGGNTYNARIDSDGAFNVNLNVIATVDSLKAGGLTEVVTLSRMSSTSPAALSGPATHPANSTLSGTMPRMH